MGSRGAIRRCSTCCFYDNASKLKGSRANEANESETTSRAGQHRAQYQRLQMGAIIVKFPHDVSYRLTSWDRGYVLDIKYYYLLHSI